MTLNTPSRAILTAFIEQESADLFVILRSYVIRMGLAPPTTAEQVTQELMNQVVVEALQSAERFDPTRRPMPWLLGIGINLIREQLRCDVHSREIPTRDLFTAIQAELSDDELFERLGAFADTNPAGQIEQAERDSWIANLLAQLSEKDQQIIQLAILNDLDRGSISRQLGITPEAARVRLHRAIMRLRSWFTAQGGMYDE